MHTGRVNHILHFADLARGFSFLEIDDEAQTRPCLDMFQHVVAQNFWG